MTNLGDIVKNMKQSISDLEDALNTKEVAEASVEVGFTPEFDRTELCLWIKFTDGHQAIVPVGWYQGYPTPEDNEAYANGKIVGIFEY